MCFENLPQGYAYLDKIDLKNNRKQFWLVQGLSVGILAVLFGVGWLIVPFHEVLGCLKSNLANGNYADYFVPIVVLILGLILYIIAHELTHAAVMYASINVKVQFGFTGWAAYAGSTAYYDKKHYVLIALAPVAVWGIVFGILNVFFNGGVWFWVIWIMQIMNVGGAAGDFFCTYKTLKYPKDILVQDTGTEMSFYTRVKSGNE